MSIQQGEIPGLQNEAAFECPHFRIHHWRLEEWNQLYSPLNVMGELRKMSAWLTANPRRKKKNLLRFVINWLNAEHAKIQRQQIERRAYAQVGANKGGNAGSKVVRGVCYSADDVAWYKSQGIEL